MMKKMTNLSLAVLASLALGSASMATDQEIDEDILQALQIEKRNYEVMTGESAQAKSETWGQLCKERFDPKWLFRPELWSAGAKSDPAKAAVRLEQIKEYRKDTNHAWTQLEKDIINLIEDCVRSSAVTPKRSIYNDKPVTQLDIRRLEDRLNVLEQNIIMLSKALPTPTKKGRR